MKELMAVVYFMNGRYHFMLFLPGVLGIAPMRFLIAQIRVDKRKLYIEAYRSLLKLKIRQIVGEDAKKRMIEGPAIYGLDADPK